MKLPKAGDMVRLAGSSADELRLVKKVDKKTKTITIKSYLKGGDFEVLPIHIRKIYREVREVGFIERAARLGESN